MSIIIFLRAKLPFQFGYARSFSRTQATANFSLPKPPPLQTLKGSEDLAQARSWVSQFKNADIPRNCVEFSFSRSSGPGGQNVNKVNTKATLRVPVSASWIPEWARDRLKKSPAYATSTQSILITSTTHRSQSQNVDDCLSKLHTLILSASSADIVNEPTAQQKAKVEGLKKAASARRMQDKKKHSATKTSRKSLSWD